MYKKNVHKTQLVGSLQFLQDWLAAPLQAMEIYREFTLPAVR